MTDKDLQRHIKSGSLLPVYLLYGEEEYLIERKAKTLLEAALGDGDPSFNLDLFRGTEHKAEEVVLAANAFPFMGSRRVVLVRESESLLKQAALGRYVEQPSPETVLILCAASAKPARKGRGKKGPGTADVLAILQHAGGEFGSVGAAVEYKALKDAEAQKWILHEAARCGKSISHEACLLLHAMRGNSARLLSQEVEKLLIALPAQQEIDIESVYSFLGTSRQYNVFEFTNAVMERDASRAQDILHHLLIATEPLMLVNMLFRQLSHIWRIRGMRFSGRATDEDARKLGLIWGWQVENIRKYVKNFPDSSY
ncbi:MAG: DNA polymerase III subunit delta, partial [Bacteroidetes bacterium]|nr:DNA polymerase III subunit delta [Bacteroidota bacterium]